MIVHINIRLNINLASFQIQIVFEAMHRMLWQGFKIWLQSKDTSVNYPTIVSDIQKIRKEFNQDEFQKLLSSEKFVELSRLYEEYKQENNGPLKVFWISYLEMVGTLLSFIRATREGNWDLHLECIRAMLPWFFAYDHVNYARYLPVYLVQMLSLEETHPEAYRLLADGDFGVQRSSSQGFSQVPVDQTIEQTLNRSTKTKGGIIGFSLKKGAVQRWIITAHSRAAFIDKCRHMTAAKGTQSHTPKERGLSRMKRDEEDVERVKEVITNWHNPFQVSEELISISSGNVANEAIQQGLMSAHAKGQDAFTSFVDSRLIRGSQDLFDPLTKLKLGTFAETRTKKQVTTGGRDIVIKADRNLFARLLVIGQHRQMDLREILAHELGPVPWSLASPDGSLAKTNKAALSPLLEDGIEFLQSLTGVTAVIIDAMAMLQTITRIPEKFSELADVVLNTVFILAGDAKRIDVVADQYPDISIKNTERSRRGREGQMEIKITSPTQLCPRQWKKAMSSGKSKTSLMNFFAQEWATNRFAEKIGERSLYITHGCDCTGITVANEGVVSTLMPDLQSNQEEADTRMFLHALHASSNGHSRVCIRSSDTDVEVLACYHQEVIPADIIIASGTRNRVRLVSIPRIHEKLGSAVCQILPGLHAITGCDTVSAFVGKGKKKALEIAIKDEGIRRAVDAIGKHIPPTDDDINNLESFVCTLYNGIGSDNINETRYNMFCKRRDLQSHQLPPTRAALAFHITRANYQCYLWKNALKAIIPGQNPEGQGWRLADGQLEVVWTNMAPAPSAVMELICCACNGTCQTRRCSCVKNALPCTDACSCREDCVNCRSDDLESDDDDSESSDDETE